MPAAIVAVVAKGRGQIQAGIAAVLHGEIARIASLWRDREIGAAANVPKNGVAGDRSANRSLAAKVTLTTTCPLAPEVNSTVP